jgi:hypothetical protein
MTTHDFSTGNLGDVILTPARPESGFLDLRGTPKFYSLAEMNETASVTECAAASSTLRHGTPIYVGQRSSPLEHANQGG